MADNEKGAMEPTQHKVRRAARWWQLAAIALAVASLVTAYALPDVDLATILLTLACWWCLIRADYLFGWAKGYGQGLIAGALATESELAAEAYAEGWKDAHDLAQRHGWK